MPFFDTFFDLEPTGFGKWLQYEKARQVLHRLQRQHPGIERILEIGPGWGEFADLVVEAQVEYYGIEANRRQTESLSRRGMSVVVAYAPPIPMESEQFDAVVALNVLEHMVDLPMAIYFLREMVRMVRPGGLICINCPDLLAVGSLFWDSDYTHNFPTTMYRVAQMFGDQGLKIVDATYFAGVVPGPLSTPVGLMARFFPEDIISFLLKPFLPRERIRRARHTFFRNVFLIGRCDA
ncbi:MAG: class I SAM-dependent methyltransferase [Anaerolineales bacterium]